MFDDEAARATRLLDALIRSSGQTASSLQARSAHLRGLAEALVGKKEISLRLILEALHQLEVPTHLFFGALFPQPASSAEGPRLTDQLRDRIGGPPQTEAPMPAPTAADLEERIRAAIDQALGR